MSKRHFFHLWTYLRRVRPAYFLAVALVSGSVAVMALRSNNQHMIVLRDAVRTADEHNGDTETALKKLQLYVTSHMNTDLSSGPTPVYPPIQLKYTYDRLVRAQGAATTEANTKLYSAAQAYCEQQNSADFSGRNRVPCIEQYVQQHNTQQLKQVPDALYKFAFISPKWSPDLAGWSLVVAILSSVALVISFGLRRLARR